MGQVPMAAVRAMTYSHRFSDGFHHGAYMRSESLFRQSLPPSWSCRRVAGPPVFKSSTILSLALSTIAVVIPYAFCALATGLVAVYVAGGGTVCAIGADRGDCLLFPFHSLWVWSKASTIRHDHAA